jgi:hypothetical protein
MSAANAERKLDEMLYTLFSTSEWIHTDAYSDDFESRSTHHYFDSSWDLAQTTIPAARPRKRTHHCLSKEIPLSEGVSNTSSHAPVPSQVDPSVERTGHSGPSAASTPVPCPKGTVFSDGIPETNPSAHPSSQTSALRSLDDCADVANQHSSTIEAPPSYVPATTATGDDSASPVFEHQLPIVSQFGTLESSAKRLRTTGTFSNVSSDSYEDIMRS